MAVKNAGIFVSYRRVDTRLQADRLFGDLRTQFGPGLVFMDTDGIARGQRFADEINEALSCCKALLALIGPAWLSCTRDGRCRLEFEDDWVRREIAAALAREDVVVMPVLLQGARCPDSAELPDEIRPLFDRQAAAILDTHWDYDVGKIVDDLVSRTPLRRSDVGSARTGLGVLKDLIAGVPAVADAVSRSKEVIENTVRQVSTLAILKQLHDALHEVEFNCLRPIQASGPATPVRPFKVMFGTAARRLNEVGQSGRLNDELRADLAELVGAAGMAFEAAVAAPAPDTYAEVVAALNLLLSSLPARIDATMVATSESLNLDHLVDLMTTVRGKLPANVSAQSPELGPFIEGLDALRRLRQELAQRVNEHTRLQRLDSELRAVCAGGVTTAPNKAWERVLRVRSRLTPPFLPELQSVNEDLKAMEAGITSALSLHSDQMPTDLLQAYFMSIGFVFRDVDHGLLGFSARLSAVSQPLQAVLAMC